MWRCSVCRKQKDLNGPHLDGKTTVRSDCWPCAKKQTFLRIEGIEEPHQQVPSSEANRGDVKEIAKTASNFGTTPSLGQKNPFSPLFGGALTGANPQTPTGLKNPFSTVPSSSTVAAGSTNPFQHVLSTKNTMDFKKGVDKGTTKPTSWATVPKVEPNSPNLVFHSGKKETDDVKKIKGAVTSATTPTTIDKTNQESKKTFQNQKTSFPTPAAVAVKQHEVIAPVSTTTFTTLFPSRNSENSGGAVENKKKVEWKTFQDPVVPSSNKNITCFLFPSFGSPSEFLRNVFHALVLRPPVAPSSAQFHSIVMPTTCTTPCIGRQRNIWEYTTAPSEWAISDDVSTATSLFQHAALVADVHRAFLHNPPLEKGSLLMLFGGKAHNLSMAAAAYFYFSGQTQVKVCPLNSALVDHPDWKAVLAECGVVFEFLPHTHEREEETRKIEWYAKRSPLSSVLLLK